MMGCTKRFDGTPRTREDNLALLLIELLDGRNGKSKFEQCMDAQVLGLALLAKMILGNRRIIGTPGNESGGYRVCVPGRRGRSTGCHAKERSHKRRTQSPRASARHR